MKLPGLALSLAVVGFALLVPEAAEAARINELSDSTLMDRAARFFTFRDPSLRNALAGSMLLGVCCGLMGAFLVVRKLSLLGDALSHAVLPGVALGFLWNMSKDPIAIFVGATMAGLLGAGAVQLLRATTTHKEDAALGFVLASFFGSGNLPFYDDPESAGREQERDGQVHVRPGGGTRERRCHPAGRRDGAGARRDRRLLQGIRDHEFRRGIRSCARDAGAGLSLQS